MWRPESPAFHAIADVLYDLESPTERWLEQVLAVVMRQLPGVCEGVAGLAALGPGGVSGTPMVATSPDLLAATIRHGMRQTPRYARLRGKHPASTDRQVMGARFDSLPHAEWATARGTADILCLYGLEPHRTSTILSLLLPEITDRWPERLVEEWEAVSLHAGHAGALRLAIARAETQREAVLTEEGRVLHAEGQAIEGREALSDAVRRIHRSRGTWRDKPEELDARTPSIDARWSLVDQFESDGRHFVVAHAVAQEQERQLSPREQRVAEYLAAGWSFKRIAYRLGLSPGAVSSYAHRAADKLGVRGRVALAHAIRRGRG